jgi:hypothetical protein
MRSLRFSVVLGLACLVFAAGCGGHETTPAPVTGGKAPPPPGGKNPFGGKKPIHPPDE